ncbi:hypothetical protein C8Q70DRAFT_1107981, partial [Cubamyces menziesii]
MNLLSSLPTEQFIRGWFQIVTAHYYNWRNGVQHRAISLDNLMCSSEDEDPVCAVLNDWDLDIDHAKDTNLAHTSFEVTSPFCTVTTSRRSSGCSSGRCAATTTERWSIPSRGVS